MLQPELQDVALDPGLEGLTLHAGFGAFARRLLGGVLGILDGWWWWCLERKDWPEVTGVLSEEGEQTRAGVGERGFELQGFAAGG